MTERSRCATVVMDRVAFSFRRAYTGDMTRTTTERRQAERRLIERSTPDRRETVRRLIDLGHQIEAARESSSRENVLARLRAELAARGVTV